MARICDANKRTTMMTTSMHVNCCNKVQDNLPAPQEHHPKLAAQTPGTAPAGGIGRIGIQRRTRKVAATANIVNATVFVSLSLASDPRDRAGDPLPAAEFARVRLQRRAREVANTASITQLTSWPLRAEYRSRRPTLARPGQQEIQVCAGQDRRNPEIPG
jgi:hypothetical protein